MGAYHVGNVAIVVGQGQPVCHSDANVVSEGPGYGKDFKTDLEFNVEVFWRKITDIASDMVGVFRLHKLKRQRRGHNPKRQRRGPERLVVGRVMPRGFVGIVRHVGSGDEN